ncbi:MAG: phosphoribosylglycinamide formyltransferase [Solirubrobacteraceae bacterium]
MNVGVLASGAGTNLQALIDRAHGVDGVQISGVASDRPQAAALERARAAGIDTAAFPAAQFDDRVARDAAIAAWLRARGVELVVLAGYMQLVGDAFLRAFPERVINVHPALLSAFPGLNAIQQALDHGVKVFGVSVFFVDGGVDTGPLILQRAIELPDAADVDEVHDRLRPLEHDLLVDAVLLIARGAVSIDLRNSRRVILRR